jgi:hypothetical protein
LKYAKLRGAIRERLGSEGVLAVKLGMNPVTLSKKLNGKTDWKKNEIEKTLEYLVIPRSEVYDYFFAITNEVDSYDFFNRAQEFIDETRNKQ